MLDYEILRLIWWVLLGVLLIGIAIMNGLDMGAAALLPVTARTDLERRIVINSVGPFWEGNQVWLILGGGAAFAAFPAVYAVSFSGFYFAIFLALFAIVLRPVGFKFRSKMPQKNWRRTWDCMLCIGGTVPPLVFGVAFGNLFLGADFYFDENLRAFWNGSFFSLFHPFALLCGIVSLFMIISQGACYVCTKTNDPICERSRICALISVFIALATFIAGGVVLSDMDGFKISSHISKELSSNPTLKQVVVSKGAWLNNYEDMPWTRALPIAAIIFGLFSSFGLFYKKYIFSMVSNSIMIFSIIATAGFSLFPFIMPSRLNPNHSLSVWDASSSQTTLFVMLIATVILLPIVLSYTTWAYKVMSGKVTKETISDNDLNAY
jgi:cytochrome d ubiquinol oxidase subunit II